MPKKKKTEKVKTPKPGKLRVAALKATRATARAARGSDFLGLTGAAYNSNAWTSATEGNPKSVWDGTKWSNVKKGPKDTRNRGYPSNYTPGDWAQGGSGTIAPKLKATGTLPSQGIANYQTPTPYKPFKEASTLLGQFYDIARHVDPGTGNMLAPYGTPGTLKFGAGTEWTSLSYELSESAVTGGGLSYPGRFGGTADIPSGYLNRSPKANDPRPRWLEWYEEINEPQWLQWSK